MPEWSDNRLWKSCTHQDPFDLLAQVYHWLTEGCGTADLQAPEG